MRPGAAGRHAVQLSLGVSQRDRAEGGGGARWWRRAPAGKPAGSWAFASAKKKAVTHRGPYVT